MFKDIFMCPHDSELCKYSFEACKHIDSFVCSRFLVNNFTFSKELPEQIISRELLAQFLHEVESNFPLEGDSYRVCSRYDASEIYGSGWNFYLRLYWEKYINDYIIDIEAAQYQLGYKSSCYIMTGSRQEIFDKVCSKLL